MNFFGLIVLGIVALIIGVLYWNTDWGLTLIVAGVVAIVGGGITALNPEELARMIIAAGIPVKSIAIDLGRGVHSEYDKPKYTC